MITNFQKFHQFQKMKIPINRYFRSIFNLRCKENFCFTVITYLANYVQKFLIALLYLRKMWNFSIFLAEWIKLLFFCIFLCSLNWLDVFLETCQGSTAHISYWWCKINSYSTNNHHKFCHFLIFYRNCNQFLVLGHENTY